MQKTKETEVPSLGQEDPPEEEMATYSSVLAWEIRWTESLEGYSPRGHKESDTTFSDQAHMHLPLKPTPLS